MADDTSEKYINPYTDFGFKKLFGTEMNKDLLISFLNALFNNSEREIEDIQYLNGESLGDGYADRRSVFVKTEDELETMFDKWLFVLHNLYRLLERPKALQDRVFQKLFEQAEIARYSETERRQYEESKKVFWDNYSVLKTAERKGILKEKIDTIHRLQAMGLAVEQIAQGADMDVEEVKKVLQ